MDAARARCLGPADQAVVAQDFSDHECDPANVVPGHAGPRIEVHAQLVGMFQVVGPNRVRVQVEAAEVGDPDQAGRIVEDDLVGGSSGRERQLDRSNPFGPRIRRPLLEEVLAFRPIHESLEGHRPAAGAAQRPIRDGQVVGHEVALGVARSGEEDLVRVADGDPPARDLDEFALVRHCRTIARRLRRAHATERDGCRVTPAATPSWACASTCSEFRPDPVP